MVCQRYCDAKTSPRPPRVHGGPNREPLTCPSSQTSANSQKGEWTGHAVAGAESRSEKPLRWPPLAVARGMGEWPSRLGKKERRPQIAAPIMPTSRAACARILACLRNLVGGFSQRRTQPHHERGRSHWRGWRGKGQRRTGECSTASSPGTRSRPCWAAARWLSDKGIAPLRNTCGATSCTAGLLLTHEDHGLHLSAANRYEARRSRGGRICGRCPNVALYGLRGPKTVCWSSRRSSPRDPGRRATHLLKRLWSLDCPSSPLGRNFFGTCCG